MKYEVICKDGYSEIVESIPGKLEEFMFRLDYLRSKHGMIVDFKKVEE